MVKSISDPNAPKRPASAFFQWRAKSYTKVKMSMPVSHTFGELAKKFSEDWNKMTEAQRKPYQDKFELEKKTYEKLMNAYKHTENYRRFQRKKKEFKVESAKKGKFAKDPNAPKKAQTAYFAFLADKRESVKTKNPKLSHKDVLKKLGEMWQKLSAAQKTPYEKKAEASKKKYEKELAAYKKTAGYKAYMASKEQFLKDRKTKVEKLEAKLTPKKSAKKAAKATKSKPAKKVARVAKRSTKKGTKSKAKKARKATKSK